MEPLKDDKHKKDILLLDFLKKKNDISVMKVKKR
jgi:hypothetical protein